MAAHLKSPEELQENLTPDFYPETFDAIGLRCNLALEVLIAPQVIKIHSQDMKTFN